MADSMFTPYCGPQDLLEIRIVGYILSARDNLRLSHRRLATRPFRSMGQRGPTYRRTARHFMDASKEPGFLA